MTFEDVCIEFIKELQKKEKLPFRYNKIGRWFGKTTVRDDKAKDGFKNAETEIDILCMNKDKTKYLVGECKFKNNPFSYSEYLNTAAKLTHQKNNAKFYYALFSENGFDDQIVTESKKSEPQTLQLFTLDDIVNLKLL